MTAIPEAALLEGLRAVVTGSTTGLGRSMATALTAAGARVVVTSRDQQRAEHTARELGPAAIGLALDVRDERSVALFVEQVRETFGAIDLLVNNAGIGMRTVNPNFLTHPQPFWQVTPDGFRDVLDTKVTGVFLVARAVVPLMLAAGSGRIVNISMSTSTMTRSGYVPYGPAGAGVEALSRIMAAELADTPITVNMLLPGGPTATAMVPEDVSPDVRTRLLNPDIMGPPIVWLASDDAKNVHDERIIATEFQDWLANR